MQGKGTDPQKNLEKTLQREPTIAAFWVYVCVNLNEVIYYMTF